MMTAASDRESDKAEPGAERQSPRDRNQTPSGIGADALMRHAFGIANPAAIQTYRRNPNLPGSDERLLARVGRIVGARLEATPGATKIPAVNMQMFMVRNYLSADE